jgi:hypothetical protein
MVDQTWNLLRFHGAAVHYALTRRVGVADGSNKKTSPGTAMVRDGSIRNASLNHWQQV